MTDNERIDEISKHVAAIIRLIGENPEREGLIKTPVRCAKALSFITQGYSQDAADVIKQAVFEYSGSKMVVVKDIEFYSMCEHHILPFFGKISIGYIAEGEMVGLSKLARLVNVFARRLQVQERLTAQVAQTLSDTLRTSGVIVLCNAMHLCMKMRGVEKQDSTTTTLDYTGRFADDVSLRDEFFKALKY